MKYIDSHAHILSEYYDDLEEVIEKSSDTLVIINGVNLDSNYEILKLVKNNVNLYGALGIHPSEVPNCDLKDLDNIETNLNNEKIIAVGETGLDLYWDKTHFDKQVEFFKKHIELSIKYNKPLIIHSRNAEEEIYEILKEYKNLKFIMHCYGGSLELAKKFIELGGLIGIGGVVTFKNAKDLQSIVKGIELDCLITETDSPYLAPEPNRGKKNEPGNIKYIVKKIAEIKGLSEEEVKHKIYNNFMRQFD